LTNTYRNTLGNWHILQQQKKDKIVEIDTM
jgi:hypothetical protein